MKARGLFLAAGAVCALSTASMAQFTATSPGPHDSNGPAGNPANGSFVHNYGGAAFQVGDIQFSGIATSTGIGSWRSELRYRVAAPSGAIFDSGQLATGNTWVGGEPVNNTTAANILGVQGAGAWTFSFWESFDDGGTASVDAIWTDVVFHVQAGAAPPPPPPAFSGSFTGTPNVLTPGVITPGTTIWDHENPQPGLTRGAGEDANGTRYTGFGWDLVGNEVAYRIDHGGGELSLELAGLSSDLDMVLIDASGVPTGVVANSQGFGGSATESIVLADLAAGVYYAVVDTFGTVNAGSDYTLTYVPAPGAAALLGMGGLLVIRRRR